MLRVNVIIYNKRNIKEDSSKYNKSFKIQY